MEIKTFEDKNLKIEKTKDYDIFKITNWNRNVDRNRVIKVKKSIMQYGLIPCPIIVNEKMEVIDGQARLQACKELDLPVYYEVVKELGQPECIGLNAYQTGWNTQSYIDSYAALGNINYVRLKKLVDEYGESIPITAILASVNNGKHTRKTLINDGTLHLPSDDYVKAKAGLDFLIEVNDIEQINGFKNKRDLFQMLLLLYYAGIIEEDRMLEKLDKYGHMVENLNGEESAISGIEKMYNWRSSDKVYFKDRVREYKDSH